MYPKSIRTTTFRIHRGGRGEDGAHYIGGGWGGGGGMATLDHIYIYKLISCILYINQLVCLYMLAICSRKRSHGWAKLVVGGPLCQLKTSKNTVGCRRNLGLSFGNLANGNHLTWDVHRALQANTINCFSHTFRNFALISTGSTNIYHIISNILRYSWERFLPLTKTVRFSPTQPGSRL